MVLHFEVTKEGRKAMVAAIEKEIGVKAKYLGVPSCAYEIGSYTVGRNGELEFGDFDDIDEAAPIINACVMATGVSPTEWEQNTEEPQDEPLGLTVALPLEKVKAGNLNALLDGKGDLIKKALGINETPIIIDEEKISFPWFSTELDADSVKAYTNFIAAICKMSREQKRISSTKKEVENEKYAFRCFLLRLGFVGAEYKTDRKILLKNLDGSSAFKSGKKEEENNEISE